MVLAAVFVESVGVVELLFMLKVLSLGLLTAMMTKFIEYCLSEGMIFWRWTLLLTYLWINSWRKKDRWKRKYLKVLGLCHYCYGTWVAMFFYLAVIGFDIYIFLFLGVNYFWIKGIEQLQTKQSYNG